MVISKGSGVNRGYFLKMGSDVFAKNPVCRGEAMVGENRQRLGQGRGVACRNELEGASEACLRDRLHSCSVALRLGTLFTRLVESLCRGLGILPLRSMTSCQQKVGLAGMAARTKMNPWGAW